MTATYGMKGFTGAHRDALAKIGKVIIAFERSKAGDAAIEHLGDELGREGKQVFRVVFPWGQDANDFLRSGGSFEEAVRAAQWLAGTRPTVVPATISTTPEPAGEVATSAEPPPSLPAPSEPEVEITDNVGFKRFIRLQKGSVSIDRDAIARDARLDGKFVLRTSTELDTDEVARAYKSLWRVERAFRETKSTLEVRPIFHHRDDTTIGHIVGCFLALRLEVDLQRRLDKREVDTSWPDLMRDLEQVKAVDVSLDGQLYRLRVVGHRDPRNSDANPGGLRV